MKEEKEALERAEARMKAAMTELTHAHNELDMAIYHHMIAIKIELVEAA